MALAKDLHKILVCPESKQPLLYVADEDVLFCPQSRLKYRIDAGIPVMLVDEAERVSDAEASRLTQRGARA